jgi:multidrug resistance efflux pump
MTRPVRIFAAFALVGLMLPIYWGAAVKSAVLKPGPAEDKQSASDTKNDAQSKSAESDDKSDDKSAKSDNKPTKADDGRAEEKKSEDKAETSDEKGAKSDESNSGQGKKSTAAKTSDSKSAEAKTKKHKSEEAKADEKEKTETYTVKKGPFKVELSLGGVFESKQNTEISIHPQDWTEWTVQSAVEQGTAVKKGDTLLKFDTTKIDEEIRDQEAERKLAELGLEQAAAEIRLKEQSMPLDLQTAEHDSHIAADDLNQFLTQDRDLYQREADFTVKVQNNALEYAKEELQQLEKMYKGDETAKETEEIVLTRTRDEVEMAKFEYELSKIFRDKTVKIAIPRREETLKENVDRTAQELQKDRTTLPIELDKQRLELEKQKFEREKAVEKLAKLQHDRDLMKITAPVDGVVYYGLCVHGKWSQGDEFATKLRTGGRITPDEVMMTLVDPTSVFVRATVPERDLWQLRRGLTGSVTPEGYDEHRLPASLDEFSLVPAPGDKYLATVLIDAARLPKDLPNPSPGMNCDLKLTAYSNDSALTLPAKAIQTDKQNDEQRYVWLVDRDGKSMRRNVTLGHRTDSTVEITEGLSVGDKVLREPPKDKDDD